MKIQAIHLVLGGDERLLQFFFHQQGHRLRYTSDEILKYGEEFSINEFILIKLSLELMGHHDNFLLKDLLALDDEFFINALNGILFYKEIPLELEDLCLN